MESLTGNKKMDCMAGIAILHKPNKQTNNNNNTNKSLNSSSAAASLQISNNNKPASICCCLWLQQTTKVVVANTNSITNDSLMKPNVRKTTTNYCCWHNNTTSRFDDRILTNYNCNTKTATAVRKQQQQQHIKRPLTPLSIAVLIMSLSLLLIQMPTMVQSKAIYDEKISASYDYNSEDQESGVAMETSAELETKLLSLLTEKLKREEHMASLRLKEAEEEEVKSELDELTSLDVLKHMLLTEEHQKERRNSLRKRHSNDLIITRYLDENNQNLEWKNPCNVARVDMSVGEPKPVTKHQIYQYYKNFAFIVGIQHEHLNYTTSKISLHDMSEWELHADVYKFLPKLNVKGNITLSRWYRNLQVYVGSFGYLARSQYKYDMEKRQYVSETSQELNKLLQSARSILCELETTINGSAPNNNLEKLNTISRKAMNGRLNFVTKNLQKNGIVVEPPMADLKFAKYSYLQYLSNMKRILKQKLRAMSKKYGFKYESDSDLQSNISNSIVGDVNSSSDFIFKSDASTSLSESFEQHFKNNKRRQTQRRRSQKRKTTKLPEA